MVFWLYHVSDYFHIQLTLEQHGGLGVPTHGPPTMCVQLKIHIKLFESSKTSAFSGYSLVVGILPPEAKPSCPRWQFFMPVVIDYNPNSKQSSSPPTLEWEAGKVGQHRSLMPRWYIPQTSWPCYLDWEHRQNSNSWNINQWLIQMKKLQNKSCKISELKLKLKTWKMKLKSWKLLLKWQRFH